MRRLLTTAAVILAAAAALPSATPAATRVTLTLDPTVGPPTTQVALKGAGYAAHEVVAIRIDGQQVGSVISGAAGRFATDLTVPVAELPGEHSIEVIGDPSGATARAPFRVRTDWLQGCFDARRSCANPYENVIGAGNAGALAPAWRAAVGTDGESSPIYASGRVFVGTTTGLAGVDPATGAIIINDHSGPVSSTPAVIRSFDPQPDPPGKVIFGTRDGILHALSTTGAALWQARLGAAPASPLVLQLPGRPGSRLFVGAGNRLFALDGNGQRLWTTVLEGGDISKAAAVFSAPPEPERVIVAAGIRLDALNAATGAVLWSAAPTRSRLGAPSIDGGDVLISDQAGTLYAIDARSGAIRTSSTAAGPISGSPAVADAGQPGPHLFVGDGGGDIYAFDEVQELPAPMWRAELGGPVDGPPVLANGVLYAATDPVDGDPHISALDAATGRPLFDATLPAAAGSPIVADGRLIAATRSGDLIAYEGPDS